MASCLPLTRPLPGRRGPNSCGRGSAPGGDPEVNNVPAAPQPPDWPSVPPPGSAISACPLCCKWGDSLRMNQSCCVRHPNLKSLEPAGRQGVFGGEGWVARRAGLCRHTGPGWDPGSATKSHLPSGRPRLHHHICLLRGGVGTDPKGGLEVLMR